MSPIQDLAILKPPYGTYWRAWGVLLIITLAMLFIGTPALLITGMCIKSAIILLWFMHLKNEPNDFVLYVLLFIFLTALVLFGLIAPDGIAA